MLRKSRSSKPQRPQPQRAARLAVMTSSRDRHGASSTPSSYRALGGRGRARSTVTARECAVLPSIPELCDEPTWAVDRIVESVCRKGELFYKVRWEDTWEPAASLQGCADAAIEELYANAAEEHPEDARGAMLIISLEP